MRTTFRVTPPAGAPAPTLTTPAPAAAASTPDGPGAGVLSGMVVPWHVPTVRLGARVVFTPDTLRLPDRLDVVKLLVSHDEDRPVAYAAAATVTGTGLDMSFRLGQTELAAAVAAEVDQLLRDGLSVGVDLDPETLEAVWAAAGDPGAAPVPLAGELREVSLVAVPQFPDARTARAGARPLVTFTAPPPAPPADRMEHPAMPAETAAPAELEAAPVLPPVDQLPVRFASITDLADQLRPLLPAGGHGGSVHPAARFASLAEYAHAVWDDPTLRFALVDQITTNNPGVIPPAWLADVVGVIPQVQPTVEATGGRAPLPDAGMALTWPYFDGNLDTLVAEQVAQKTEITSVRVDLKAGSSPIRTFAGGSDLSYQLLLRSEPSYLETYVAIMTNAFTRLEEATFQKALETAAVNASAGTVWAPATGTADQLRAALFAASAQVEDATGAPATVVLAASDVWLKIGGLGGLWPAGTGTQNVAGTADASSLEVNVSGLRVVRARFMAAGELLVTNGTAARWHGTGAMVASADDVAKLGRNVAVWGMGAARVGVPAGVVDIPAA